MDVAAALDPPVFGRFSILDVCGSPECASEIENKSRNSRKSYCNVPNCRGRGGYDKPGVVLQDKHNKRKGHNKRGGVVRWKITLKGCDEQ